VLSSWVSQPEAWVMLLAYLGEPTDVGTGIEHRHRTGGIVGRLVDALFRGHLLVGVHEIEQRGVGWRMNGAIKALLGDAHDHDEGLRG